MNLKNIKQNQSLIGIFNVHENLDKLKNLSNIISSLILFVIFPIIHFSWGLGLQEF